MKHKITGLLLATCLSLSAAAQQVNDNTAIPPTAPPATEIQDAGHIDQAPEFPGGQAALMSYLSRNLQYPGKAIDAGVEGQVIVQFVVCEDGTLCKESIVKRLGSGCDEEVLRVIKRMPNWKPGKFNGKPVKVYHRLPVTFKFAEEKEEKTEKK